MPNPNHKLFDEFKKKYEKILDPIIKELQKQNFTEKNIDALINKLFSTHQIEKRVTNVIIDLSIDAFVVGGSKVTYDTTKKWLLKNNWFEDDLNLSERIHKNIKKTKVGIASILKENLGHSVNWQKSAQKIYKLKDLPVELPKYMNEIVRLGKKALQDPALIADFNKSVKKYQKQIDKLTNLGYKTPRLQKAYNNIIKQVKKGSIDGLDKGIERAIKAKTHYYAQRIARTEIASAYGNAVLYNAKKDERIVGVRSVLSSRHKIIDICDVHHSVNQYGMGKGVFPKGKVPPFPYHVQCMCSLVPVTNNQIQRTKKVNRTRQINKFVKIKPTLENKKGEIPFLTNKFHKIRKPTT